MALLYHEAQDGALCGVHTLNTLLQGPLFTAFDLAEVARNLDHLERALLDDGGAAAMGTEHGNLDDSGMFSSQVLSVALEAFQLTIHPITSPEMKGVAEEPTREDAFICNLEEHWFTIRKVQGGAWFNFNSLYPAPEALSSFYLGAYLASLREQGFTIFVVRGQLPRPALPSDPGGGAAAAGPGRWLTPEQAKELQEQASQARQVGRTNLAIEKALERAAAAGGTLQLRSRRDAPAPPPGGAAAGEDDEDAQLAAAIAASLQEGGGGGGGGGAAAGLGAGGGLGMDEDSEDFELQAALAASQQVGGGGGEGSGAALDPDMVEALAVARAAERAERSAAAGRGGGGGGGAGGGPSAGAAPRQQTPPPPPSPPPPAAEPLQPEPEPGEGVIELAFRLPGGSRVVRRFAQGAGLSQLHSFAVEHSGAPLGSFKIHTQFPRKELPNEPSVTLVGAGLEHRQALTVDPTGKA